MSDSFDPYYKWLGIPPKDQPAHHYRLLGIELFESDLQVIESAADRQMSHVRTYQAGKNSAVSQRILNELSAAKITLLHPGKKTAYDAQLQQQRPGSIPSTPPTTAAASATSSTLTMPVPPAAFQTSPPPNNPSPPEPSPAGDFGFASTANSRRRRKPTGSGIPPQVWILAVLCLAVAIAAALLWYKIQNEKPARPPPPTFAPAEGTAADTSNDQPDSTPDQPPR